MFKSCLHNAYTLFSCLFALQAIIVFQHVNEVLIIIYNINYNSDNNYSIDDNDNDNNNNK